MTFALWPPFDIKALTPDLAEVVALPLSADLRHAAGALQVPAAFAPSKPCRPAAFLTGLRYARLSVH